MQSLTIESLLDRLQPDVLAIAEPSYEDLDIQWDSYQLLKGYIQKGSKIRLNILIKNNIKFTQSYWRVEVPNLTLKLDDRTITFVYREWAKCGDQSSKTMVHQMERWSKFVMRWSQEKGKRRMLMGDLNFDYWLTDGSQMHLKPIRDLVHDTISSGGWYQLIKEPTRYQNQSVSCLDRLYSRSVNDLLNSLNYYFNK